MTATAPQILTDQLLEEFSSRLEQLGVPAIAAAQPGLTSEVMQSLVAPLGISLPVEARVWWGWHDGVSQAAGPAATEVLRWKWLPLAEAVAQSQMLRELVAEIDDPRPVDERWGPEWLLACQEQGSVVIDTAVPDDAPCPVRIWWPDDPTAPPVLPSLGELIMLWIEAIDSGVWSYDRGTDHWVLDHPHLNRWAATKWGAL